MCHHESQLTGHIGSPHPDSGYPFLIFWAFPHGFEDHVIPASMSSVHYRKQENVEKS
jgi:hypothetical protein